MRRTTAEHERVVDLVEEQMVLGLDRPNPILRTVNKVLTEDDKAPSHVLLGDKRTVQKMMDEVRARWRQRDGEPEARRQELLAQAEEGMRRSYAVLAVAQRNQNLAAQVGALRNVEKFQQRRARLLGLDNIKVAIGGDPNGVPIKIAAKLDELDVEALRKLADEP